MKILDKTLVLLILMGLTFSMQAQEDSIVKPSITISGYADAYYNLSFNAPGVGPQLWGPAAGARAFDINNNQFSLGAIQGKVTYDFKNIEVVGDFLAGPNTSLATLLFFPSSSIGNGLLGGGSFGIKQLYGVWKASDKVSFTIGQFGTHIGYEVIEPYINFNYSLSNLFNNGPFFHTGLKMNYAISDKVGLMLGLVNSWDNFDDNNGFKSPVVQLSLMPVEGMSIYLNYLTGKGDQAGSITIGDALEGASKPNGFNTSIYDLTAAYAIGKVNLGVNAAYGIYKATDSSLKTKFKAITSGEKDNPTWGGVAGYFNVAATDEFSIGARVEQFNDFYGVRYIGAKNTSVTITGSISIADGSLLLKPELRFDSSTGKNNVNGHTDLYFGKDGKTEASQTTLGMSAIFKF